MIFGQPPKPQNTEIRKTQKFNRNSENTEIQQKKAVPEQGSGQNLACKQKYFLLQELFREIRNMSGGPLEKIDQNLACKQKYFLLQELFREMVLARIWPVTKNIFYYKSCFGKFETCREDHWKK